jgi:hypothetical protein
MPMTGPKLSSRITCIWWFTSTSTVGSKYQPRRSSRAPPTSTLAPRWRASAT